MVELHLAKVVVVGSSPIARSIFLFRFLPAAGVLLWGPFPRRVPMNSLSSFLPFCAALTGGIACGKSVAAARFAALGAPVLDADDVSHALTGPGGEAVGGIASAFGREFLLPDGAMDRKKMAALVFSDPAAKAELEAILHPRIRAAFAAWRRTLARPGLAVVPLLHECGWAGDFDRVACVVASRGTVLPRLLARGLSPAEAEARLASQMPVGEKARLSDRTLSNDGSLAEFLSAVDALHHDWFTSPERTLP